MRFFSAGRVFLSLACLAFFAQPLFAQTSVSKYDIYSKLKCCSCQDPFDRCTCKEAGEMKGYIGALLEMDLGQEDIFYRIAKKFSPSVITDGGIRQAVEKRIISEVGDKRPQVSLLPASVDLGTVSQKQGKINTKFTLTNRGKTDLLIKQIKTFCPCAAVGLTASGEKSQLFGTQGSPQGWNAVIKAGQSAELDLVVDFASSHVKTGKLIREALVVSNDPLQPEINARVEAVVTE